MNPNNVTPPNQNEAESAAPPNPQEIPSAPPSYQPQPVEVPQPTQPDQFGVSQSYSPQSNQQVQQPQPPTSYVQPSPTVAPQPASTSGNSSKKKLFIILGAAIAGLIALVGIGLLIFFMIFAVTKQDFKQAYEDANDLRTAYTKLYSVSYASSYATETESKNNLDTIKESQQDFDKSMVALSEDKAILRDEKAKSFYNTLATKKIDYDKALNAITETYEKILPAFSGFKDISYTNADDAMSAIAKLQSDMEAINGLKDTNNKQFVEKMIALLAKYKVLAQKVAAYQADYTKYDANTSKEYYQVSSDITDATTDWTSNLQKLSKDGEINDELNDLGEYLSEKASGR
jgi:cytoskeletal protein RodZ